MPGLACLTCDAPAATHSKPHCRTRVCGWIVCKRCHNVYELPRRP